MHAGSPAAARAHGPPLAFPRLAHCDMLVPLLALLQALAGPATYNGMQGQIHVRPPRLSDSAVVVDGTLDEPVWSRAARLDGFSQYVPVDGRPASDSTVVLIWYSATALYVGVLAYEAHGTVHATLADRDHIAADDYVQVLLDTFDDHRQAYVFGVNPLGVQADGMLSEGIQSHGAGIGGAAAVRDTVDLSTDYRYASRGHVTSWGYEVELRIPLKSIRFQSRSVQTWGINIVRQVQHSGYQDTWTPARQAAASFLAQSGTLEGLTGLRRGHVLDINPELTSHVDGAASGAGWGYDAGRPQLGGNVRLALTQDLTADGTVRPDFSQVESDVPQLVYDPRDALYYPEKRPFFLDGLEQFDTPNRLIYTRRIVQPDAAVKLTGKLAGTDLGFLSAVDARSASATGRDHPVFTLLRARRDIGRGLTLGAVVADREDGATFNRVYGADARVLFGGIWSLRLQAAASDTRSDSATRAAPLWQAVLDRSGRRVRLHYVLSGLHPDFRDYSGYIPRSGIVHGSALQSVTLFGAPGSLVESWTGGFVVDRTWDYTKFVNGRAATDVRWHFDNQVTLRGGWILLANLFVETYGYDPSLYANYYIERHTAVGVDTIPFTGQAHIPNLDFVAGVTTPTWSRFDASIQTITGHDENFYEWALADILLIDATVNWRPSDRARVSFIYSQQQYIRRTDHSTVGIRRIPRLKVEYQVARPIFLRVVGQYDAEAQDSLRDDSRTNDPILLRDPATGTFTRAAAQSSNALRVDWLFSYQPTPGTVFFLGYGNSMTEPDAFAFRRLRRVSDGFFVKLSYLFRVGG